MSPLVMFVLSRSTLRAISPSSGFAAGRYSVEVSAPGFGVNRRTVQLAGQDQDISVAMNIGDVSQQVTVEANAVNSIASALAPMNASLDARSARTLITPAFIQNFTSPLADYGEAVAMSPGTFTLNGNGVGLGQSKTYFRGFPDGDYDIDFDGIPFYDTNTSYAPLLGFLSISVSRRHRL